MVLQNVALKDLTFHIPMTKEVSTYMSGLGVSGGLRPDSVAWDWEAPGSSAATARDSLAGVWIGNRQAGLRFNLATSFSRNGKGGLIVGIKGRSMLINDYSGRVELKKGDVLVYHFEGMITREPPNDIHLSEK